MADWANLFPNDPARQQEAQNAWQSYISRGWGGYNNYADRAGGAYTRGLESGMNAYGFPTSYLGYSNLLDILRSQGKTNPQAMNLNLSDISRSGQAAQTGLQGQAAMRGLGNSGLMQALNAAIGQGTAANRASTIASENQKAEARRRSDLGLFQSLMVQPGIDQLALALGQYGQQSQNRTQQQSAGLGALASILGALFGG